MSVRRLIPNAITSMNLLCGVLGVIAALEARFDLAFYWMLCGAVCDFFDGLTARALKVSSPMGKELDSLADVVTFGVLPSVMLYELMRVCTFSNSVWCYVPLLIAVFSGLRLAKFNLDERQHSSFLGLPTPASAMICGSLCYFIAHDMRTFLAAWASGFVFIPVLSVVLAVLLVSEIPMFSMKFSAEDGRMTKRTRVLFAVNVLLVIGIVFSLHLNWSLAVLLAFLVYVLMNLCFAAWRIND
ncbi:MAG: CDP-diacylglycerol--serine O-phosphatidyltransferase [Bacteroidales bacterium]|nr:CDP-diacylglycerol--serine O-phosphatidyltransferase [Bacteroidales bacterium]